MPKSVNTYIKGLNKDNSRSKYDPSSYYDALNIKVITNGGLSTGSVETEKGNSLSFTVPDIPEQQYTYVNGTAVTIPAQANLRIIGWCSVSNYVVLFTTTLNGGIGQIWRFQYEEKTNTVITTGGGTSLNINDHLIYNNDLGLSIDHRIEAEGRYENRSKIHVYWTDNLNQLRSINILNPDSLNIDPGSIDITPNLTFCQPTVKEITFGGSLPVGSKVQYSYRLVSDEGAQTTLSPPSQLVTLIKSDASTEPNYTDIVGSAPDSGNERAVTFDLKGIDLGYKLIHHIAILYTVKDAPLIFKFGEEAITGPNITVTLTGAEPRIALTEVEFSATIGGFEKCKTLAAKGNRLVIGNISTASIEIPTEDWDARAYRFNKKVGTNPTEAELYNSSGVLENTLASNDSSTGPNYDSIAENTDAINLFNHEQTQRVSSIWSNSYQYKYKTDGVTLGGEGKNVSYTFITEELEVDNSGSFNSKDTSLDEEFQRSRRQQSPFVSATRKDITENTGMFSPDGTDLTLTYTNVFPNFSDPYVETLYTGYTRGEVYRFGIEFYLKKGHTTFVKWIGDIKFPEVADSIDYAVGTGTVFSGSMNLKTIGIQFNIDISSIKNKIGGFRILRAERPVDQMTKLGTGFLLIANRRRGDGDVVSGAGGAGFSVKYINSLAEAAKRITGAAFRKMETGINKLNIDGQNGRKANRFHLPDFPGFNRISHNGYEGVHLKQPKTKNFTIFLSPLTVYKDTNGFVAKGGDYIKVNGYYDTALVQYQDMSGPVGAKAQLSSSWAYYSRFFETPTHSVEYFKIDKTKYIADGVRLNKSDPIIPDSTTDNNIPSEWEGNDQDITPDADFVNTTYAMTSEISVGIPGQPFGIGNKIYLMTLEEDVANFKKPEDMEWNSNVLEGTQEIQLQQTGVIKYTGTSNRFKYKEVSWSRPLEKQYGGDSYEDRSKQQYMSTGHFQPITSAVLAQTNNGESFSPRIFGGDTYVCYWGRNYIQQYYDTTNQNPAGEYNGVDNKPKRLGVTAIVPVESYVNINLSTGTYFLKDRNSNGSLSAYLDESYNVEELYTQQNNSEDKFFAKDFAADFTEEFPHRLWASEAKQDGEEVDSWRDFRVANILDVEGSYGPINKVINFQDKLFYYQDRAFGIAAINERSIITDNSGVQLALGTGDVLQDFRYSSTTTGTRHQFSVVASTSSIYHYDATLRKLYKMSANGQEPVSDLKGLSNFFADNVDGEIIEVDKTLRETSPTGVHSTFDYRNNRALFTFLNPKSGTANFTVSYNEMMGAFESFYSFVPNMYLNTGRRILSTDPQNQNESYVHNDGVYGNFYNTTYPSHLTLVVSPDALLPKLFTNIEYNSEIDINDIDQKHNETLTSLEIWNDYQTTGIIPLIVGTNVKRRMRHWRHTIGRDINSVGSKARMRDYSVYIKVSYDNNNNKRLVLHDIIVSYTLARD